MVWCAPLNDMTPSHSNCPSQLLATITQTMDSELGILEKLKLAKRQYGLRGSLYVDGGRGADQRTLQSRLTRSGYEGAVNVRGKNERVEQVVSDRCADSG
ncbi:unnamed protein product [Protopolystoma xenopodis]|uniref:Uncharacterized protein n=1 Tax=Protopolystoma xenopodis TaxID=117903 RepID=A0A3S5AG03_9PLAT|nr:unnamed protein product [Protopolystoma xenopodis]